MFKNYPHKNKTSKDKPNIIVKSLVDKLVLRKEFYILHFLKNYSFIPQVSDFDGKIFLEEKLSGREITRNDLTDNSIKEVALILRKIHLLDIPYDIKKYIHNDFLLDGKYQPILIMQTILKEAPPEIINKYKKILYKIAKDIELKLGKKSYQIGLIHGDLSLHNIFLQKDNLFLIDWVDCRLDISSCDVSQLFYLLNLNQAQEKLFLKYYNMDYIDDQLLIFHKLLLLLHDLANSFIKREVLDKSLTLKLDSWSKSFYG